MIIIIIIIIGISIIIISHCSTVAIWFYIILCWLWLVKRPKTKRNNPKMTQKAKSKLPAPDVLHNVVKTGSTSTESTSTEICICLERAEGLPQADFLGTADPYVEVLVMTCDPLKMDLKKSEIKNLSGPLLEKTLFKATSRIIRGSLTPQWQESFYFSIPNGCEEATLYFRVLDYDLVISDDFLGHCSISLLKLGWQEVPSKMKILLSNSLAIFITIWNGRFGIA